MGGCRCSYKNCSNTTKTTDNIHFFHYPVKHKERCAAWIRNAQKPEFCNLEEEQLRNKVVCENHFEFKWFTNPHKKRLLQGAVPTLDGPTISAQAQYRHLLTTTTPPQADNTYLSNEVQVLPANEDGTLFVLDSNLMYNKSQEVESYIYKNGMIVPADVKPKDLVVEPSRTYVGAVKSEFQTSTPYKAQQSNEVIVKHENTEEMAVDDGATFYKDENQTDNAYKKILPSKKKSTDKTINKSYLRTIKRHSRDIANIKKMLKEQKPDVNTTLDTIKDRIPPSLYTILNLCLNNRYELNNNDVEFFTKLHNTSPEAYQLLVKYGWDLPAVDVVDTSVE